MKKLLQAALCVALLALPAEGQLSQAGGSRTPPVVLKQVNPKYPHGKSSKESEVLVGLEVDTEGMPQNVHVITSGGDGFDQAAIDAVQQYRFQPATVDGKPIRIQMKIKVNFKHK